jgi:hypothetical protein
MVNENKLCQTDFCEGRMVLTRKDVPAEDPLSPGAGFTIDEYECDECGALDWDD